MAKVTEKEIVVHQDSAKNYVEAAKNVIDVIVANIPGLTQESVITNTGSAYRVRCYWNKNTDFVLDFSNGNNGYLTATWLYNNGLTYVSGGSTDICWAPPHIQYGANKINYVKIMSDEGFYRVAMAETDHSFDYSRSLYLTTLLDRISMETLPVIGSVNNLYTSRQNKLCKLDISTSGAAGLTNDDVCYAVPIILTSTTVPISGKLAGSNDFYRTYLRGTQFKLGDRIHFAIGGTKFYSLMDGDVCVKEA